MEENASNVYSKLTLFRNRILEYEGNENINIPDEVIANIKKNFTPDIDADYEDTIKNLRKCLNKLNYRKYYENMPYILKNHFNITRKPCQKTKEKFEEYLKGKLNIHKTNITI